MKAADFLLLDFDSEMEKAKAYFSIIPEDKAGWKPHERSATLGQVAKHVATLPQFGKLFFDTDVANLKDLKGPQLNFIDRADLFTALDTSAAALRQAVAACSEERLMQPWTLMNGDITFISMPRAIAYRSMFLNHFIHHRAQLGVTLRLLDVPIPGLYGPSADDVRK